MFCSKCGSEIQPEASFCSQCGSKSAQVPEKIPESPTVVTVREEDRPSGGMIALIWIFACFPLIGGTIVLIVSSVLYFTWKTDFPKKAKSINRHGWMAYGFSTACFLFYYFVVMNGNLDHVPTIGDLIMDAAKAMNP